jgi:hypothetical protein
VSGTVADLTTGTASSASYNLGTGASVSQVRAGAEYGQYAPWDIYYYFGPGSPQFADLVGRFTYSTLTSYSGHRATFSSWWVSHKIIMTSEGGLSGGIVNAAPGDMTHGGANFGVYLCGGLTVATC